MAPFDLVVLLILSEAVQNALVADEKSPIGGMVVAATLFGASQFTGYLAWSNKGVERLLGGTPRVLVRNGRVNNCVLAAEQITRSKLIEAVRRKGYASLSRVRFAVLENNGTIMGLKQGRSSCGATPDRGTEAAYAVCSQACVASLRVLER